MSRPTAPFRCGPSPTPSGWLAFLVAAFPVYWMVNSSPSSTATRSATRCPPGCLSAATSTTSGPSSGTDQFVDALEVSLMVTGLTIVVALLFAFVAAVAVSRFRFPRAAPLHRDAAGDPDDPGGGALHLPVQDARGDGAAQHRRRPHARVRRERPALHHLDPAGLRRRRPLRAGGGGDDRRLLPHAGVLPDHPAAARARAGRDRRLRLHPGVERVHARAGRDDPRGPAHAASVAHDLRRRQPRHRLGRDHGRVDPHRRARSSSSSSSSRAGWSAVSPPGQ